MIKIMKVKVKNALRYRSLRLLLPAALLLVITALGILVFHWYPIHVKLTDALSKTDKYNQKIRLIKLEQTAQESSILAAKRADIIEKKAASTPESGYAESEINRLSSKAGLRLSIENEGIQTVRGYIKTSFSISVNGSYNGLRKFVNSLENMKQLVYIKNLRIEEESSARGMVKGIIELDIIRLKAAGNEK